MPGKCAPQQKTRMTRRLTREINRDETNELRIRIVCNFDEPKTTQRGDNSSPEVASTIRPKVARRTGTVFYHGNSSHTGREDEEFFTPGKTRAVWNFPFRDSILKLRNRVGKNSRKRKKCVGRPEIRKCLFPDERMRFFGNCKVMEFSLFSLFFRLNHLL